MSDIGIGRCKNCALQFFLAVKIKIQALFCRTRHELASVLTLTLVLSLWAPAGVGLTLWADDVPIEISEVAVNGSGCPPGSIAITTTPDNLTAAVLFREYKARTDSTHLLAISDCALAVGLEVEPGFYVGIVGIDWRGTVVTTPGAVVNFHREFFFSGSVGRVSDYNWTEEVVENFFLEDDPTLVINGSCDGTPLIARVNSSATVVGYNSMFSLQSADIEANLMFTLLVRRCGM